MKDIVVWRIQVFRDMTSSRLFLDYFNPAERSWRPGRHFCKYLGNPHCVISLKTWVFDTAGRTTSPVLKKMPKCETRDPLTAAQLSLSWVCPFYETEHYSRNYKVTIKTPSLDPDGTTTFTFILPAASMNPPSQLHELRFHHSGSHLRKLVTYTLF
jgi:hypothetical protein